SSSTITLNAPLTPPNPSVATILTTSPQRAACTTTRIRPHHENHVIAPSTTTRSSSSLEISIARPSPTYIAPLRERFLLRHLLSRVFIFNPELRKTSPRTPNQIQNRTLNLMSPLRFARPARKNQSKSKTQSLP
ncbi:hypothetical protein V8G54_037791, partial [Vigna mungo]